MKYAIACLLASTSALTIRNHAAAGASCDDSYKRAMSQATETVDGDLVKNNMVDGKFVDPSFKAGMSMLYAADENTTGGGADGNGSQINTWVQTAKSPGIAFKRPSETQKGKLSLCGENGISVDISQQGNDGDCWFLSQASSLAAYPERVKAMFPGQDEYSDIGAFQVRLFVRGKPVNVVVDDIIPRYGYTFAAGYNENYPSLVNSPSRAGAWWLVILEKAMAKLNQSYIGINGGQTAESMRYMTGQPTVQYTSKNLDPDALWDIVQDGLANNYNMGAVCNVSHFNMISGHAYGLIGAVTLKGGAHDGMRMLKTRNPWGINKYDGPWSEKSADWTPEYRKQADDYGTKNIGDIWLPLDVWNNDYADLSVNLFRDDWKVTTVQGEDFKYDVLWGDLNTWLTVDNPVEQEVVIECYQNNERMFPDQCESENSPMNFNFQWLDDHRNSHHHIAQ